MAQARNLFKKLRIYFAIQFPIMVHSVVAAFLVGMAAASPITDVWIIEYKRGNCDEVEATTGHGVSGNLNQDTKGDDIRLCSSGGSGKPITDLKMFKDNKHVPDCGSGWSKVQGRDGANGDLNQGRHGKYETLCQRNEDNKPPIVDLQLRYNTNCDDGWHLVSSTGSSSDPDFNEHGHGNGKKMYLCYQLGCTLTDIVGYWHPIQTVSKNDELELTQDSDFSETKVSSSTVIDSITHSKTHVSHWGHKIKTNIKTHTDTWSDTVTSTIHLHSSAKYTHKFKRAGYAWQWWTDVETSCGKMTLQTHEVVTSESRDDHPCCYPGEAVSQDDAAVCRGMDDLLGGTDHGCKVRKSGETRDKFQTNDEGVVGNATSILV